MPGHVSFHLLQDYYSLAADGRLRWISGAIGRHPSGLAQYLTTDDGGDNRGKQVTLSRATVPGPRNFRKNSVGSFRHGPWWHQLLRQIEIDELPEVAIASVSAVVGLLVSASQTTIKPTDSDWALIEEFSTPAEWAVQGGAIQDGTTVTGWTGAGRQCRAIESPSNPSQTEFPAIRFG